MASLVVINLCQLLDFDLTINLFLSGLIKFLVSLPCITNIIIIIIAELGCLSDSSAIDEPTELFLK